MADSKTSIKAYCDRIRREVVLNSNGVPSGCRYFVSQNGKPICKKVLLGRSGIPFPTPSSIAKLMFRSIIEPMLVFTSMSLGRATLPSWWCKLCAHGAEPSKSLEVAGKVFGLMSGDLSDGGSDSIVEAIKDFDEDT